MCALLPENVVENKLQGERFEFAKRSDDVCSFAFTVHPGGGMPMLHCHEKQSEIFVCHAGELTVLLSTGERVLRAGEELRLAPGEFHAFQNRGRTDVRCTVEYRPAGRNEDWLKVTSATTLTESRAPSLLEIAPFLGDVDMFVQGPPIAIQRVLYAVLRWLAIALGHKKRMLARASQVYGRPFVW